MERITWPLVFLWYLGIKYKKKLFLIFSYILKRILLKHSKRNLKINKVNWNILLTLGKEIKWD